jgi:hypothetical protein
VDNPNAKQIINDYICEQLLKAITVPNEDEYPPPSILVRRIIEQSYLFTAAARQKLKENVNLSYTDLDPVQFPCVMDHCTCFALKACPLVNIRKDPVLLDSVNLLQFNIRKCTWHWKAFSNMPNPQFDIFNFLQTLDPYAIFNF